MSDLGFRNSAVPVRGRPLLSADVHFSGLNRLLCPSLVVSSCLGWGQGWGQPAMASNVFVGHVPTSRLRRHHSSCDTISTFALLCLPSIPAVVTMIRLLARSILPEQRWPLDARRQTWVSLDHEP